MFRDTSRDEDVSGLFIFVFALVLGLIGTGFWMGWDGNL
jgi:hypothetical protein